jgi:hypothetical protein
MATIDNKELNKIAQMFAREVRNSEFIGEKRVINHECVNEANELCTIKVIYTIHSVQLDNLP